MKAPSPSETESEIRLKYIDDQTQAEAINLKNVLDMKANIDGPRNYHDRHGHKLISECSKLQSNLEEISKYADLHQLKINEKKTKIMPFNFSKKYDFMPILTLGKKELEVVYETKL